MQRVLYDLEKNILCEEFLQKLIGLDHLLSDEDREQIKTIKTRFERACDDIYENRPTERENREILREITKLRVMEPMKRLQRIPLSLRIKRYEAKKLSIKENNDKYENKIANACIMGMSVLFVLLFVYNVISSRK